MMNLYRRNNSHKRWPVILISALVIFAGSIDVLSDGHVRGVMRDYIIVAVSYMDDVYNITQNSSFFKTKKSLLEENSLLRNQLNSLKVAKLQNSVLKSENDTLRKLLSISESSEQGVVARVVSKLHASPYGTIVLSFNDKSKVSNEDYVFSPSGFVIGKIRDLSKKSAVASLFTAPGIKTDIIVSGISTVMTGRGLSNAIISLPREAKLSIGDVVYLQGTGAMVGIVGYIKSEPTDSEQTILLSAPINVDSLHFVFIKPLI